MQCNSDLPFFPKYTIHNENDKITVTWFEAKFSQSHYNYENVFKCSNACTLIAVLMAGNCRNYKIIINGPKKELNEKMIYVLACSILEGNTIHENLKQEGVLDNFNLTVPEAIKFAGLPVAGIVEWKSLIFMESLSQTLFTNIKNNWVEWLKTKCNKINNDLYVILIADNLSVLFIIQYATDTVTLIDSHKHSENYGAFIAVTDRDKLRSMCRWFSNILKNCYKKNPDLYELSFLYFS